MYNLRVKRFSSLVVIIAIAITACMPSAPYQLGMGFYSESYSKTQVQAAASSGKMKFLGKFTQDGSSCRNYTMDRTDNTLILPVVKSQLNQLQGNAADNIVAKFNMKDLVFAITIFPLLAGCRSFTISGEALMIQP